jgi:hypothetical protein
VPRLQIQGGMLLVGCFSPGETSVETVDGG